MASKIATYVWSKLLNYYFLATYVPQMNCSLFPADFLGYVKVDLQSASQKHQTQQGVTQMHLKKQHLPLKDGKGTLTVDFELKWEHPHT